MTQESVKQNKALLDDQHGKQSMATRIVNVNSELKERVIVSGSGDSSGADLAAIKRAENALEELSENFDDWIEREIEALKSARDSVRDTGLDSDALEKLFCAAHDLKGQAATLGYPLAAEICASLCALIDNLPNKNRIPMVLIDQHVDAVRAMINECVKDTENEKAKELIRRLSLVTDEFIISENKRHKIRSAS